MEIMVRTEPASSMSVRDSKVTRLVRTSNSVFGVSSVGTGISAGMKSPNENPVS